MTFFFNLILRGVHWNRSSGSDVHHQSGFGRIDVAIRVLHEVEVFARVALKLVKGRSSIHEI